MIATMILSIFWAILIVLVFLAGAWSQRKVPSMVRRVGSHDTTTFEVIPQGEQASWNSGNGQTVATGPRVGREHPGGTPIPPPNQLMSRGRQRIP